MVISLSIDNRDSIGLGLYCLYYLWFEVLDCAVLKTAYKHKNSMYVLSVWRIPKQCAPVCRTEQYFRL